MVTSSVWSEPRLPPPIAREFRGAWIATVANIDWPSQPGLPAEEQRAEMIALLDCAVELRLNAIVLQVRPACDAIYPSKLEPWSGFLSGEAGKAPNPSYDPLAFAVEEAHRRGLQLHAWFNPYRASHPSWKGSLSSDHVRERLPNAVVEYGNYLWLDPGDESAAAHSLAVILDVVRRYDIDGVHFDDYFYPYPITEKVPSDSKGEAEQTPQKVPFPDDDSWQRYVSRTAEGERLSRDDWRRDNVNRFIRSVSEGIKREKPWVMFGVSPFGIWRPGHPESVVGFDAYGELYADARLWLEEGWVDYFTPQLYWPIRSSGQSYPVLLDWWRRQNHHNRALWPGLFTSRVRSDPDAESGWSAREIVEQVRLTQGARGASGNIHFSMKALAKNYDGVADKLRMGPYAKPAVIPTLRSLKAPDSLPLKPTLDWSDKDRLAISTHGKAPWLWVAQSLQGGEWVDRIAPGEQTFIEIAMPKGRAPDRVVVTPLDRYGRAGASGIAPASR